jgi:hypothetical protein
MKSFVSVRHAQNPRYYGDEDIKAVYLRHIRKATERLGAAGYLEDESGASVTATAKIAQKYGIRITAIEEWQRSSIDKNLCFAERMEQLGQMMTRAFPSDDPAFWDSNIKMWRRRWMALLCWTASQDKCSVKTCLCILHWMQSIWRDKTAYCAKLPRSCCPLETASGLLLKYFQRPEHDYDQNLSHIASWIYAAPVSRLHGVDDAKFEIAVRSSISNIVHKNKLRFCKSQGGLQELVNEIIFRYPRVDIEWNVLECAYVSIRSEWVVRLGVQFSISDPEAPDVGWWLLVACGDSENGSLLAIRNIENSGSLTIDLLIPEIKEGLLMGYVVSDGWIGLDQVSSISMPSLINP